MRSRVLIELAALVCVIVSALAYGSYRERAGRVKEKDTALVMKGATVMADLKRLRPAVKKSAVAFHAADSLFRVEPTVEKAEVALDAAVVHIAGQDSVISKLDTLVATQQSRLTLKYPAPARVIPFVAVDFDPFKDYKTVRAGVLLRVTSHLRTGIAVQIASDTTVRKMVTVQYDFR